MINPLSKTKQGEGMESDQSGGSLDTSGNTFLRKWHLMMRILMMRRNQTCEDWGDGNCRQKERKGLGGGVSDELSGSGNSRQDRGA